MQEKKIFFCDSQLVEEEWYNEDLITSKEIERTRYESRVKEFLSQQGYGEFTWWCKYFQGPKQTDSTSCGVHVIAMAGAINNNSFTYDANVSKLRLEILRHVESFIDWNQEENLNKPRP
jgi:hypothetical protein